MLGTPLEGRKAEEACRWKRRWESEGRIGEGGKVKVIGGVEIKSGKRAVGEERYVEARCERGEVGVHMEGRDGRHQKMLFVHLHL